MNNIHDTNELYKKVVRCIHLAMGDLEFAKSIAKSCNGKLYVHISDDDSYELYVKVRSGSYYDVKEMVCKDINDNEVENSPRFYDMDTYRSMFPGKSLIVENYFHFSNPLRARSGKHESKEADQ